MLLRVLRLLPPIGWLSAGCFAVTGFAEAACPDRESAKNGFKLVAVKQAAVVDVAPFQGSSISYTVTPAGAEPVTVRSQDGLFDLATRSQSGETTTVYSIDVAAADPLKMDATLSFEMTSTGPDGKQLTGATQQRAVERETIAIGECNYDTIVIQASSRFAGTPFQSRRRLNYSPDLKMVIRAEFRANDGRNWVQEYEKIEAR
jgi:hypothetical protein